MKKILIVLIAMFALSSCDNTPMEVSEPEKTTTLEILNLAQADTTCSKVVILDDVLYVVDNGLVTHKVRNDTGLVRIIVLILIVITFGVILVAALSD